jgi:hypothetical protein
MKNLFKNLPESVQKEIFEVIIENKDIRLERIISCGHATLPYELLPITVYLRKDALMVFSFFFVLYTGN